MREPTPSKRKRETREESYDRRAKAAGLTDDMPEDLDEFRYQLARRITMFLNTWKGCPEFICRRNRGCMAPNISCSNVERLSEEEEERQWYEVHADVAKAIKAQVAAIGAEDD